MVGPIMANFSLDVTGPECRPRCQNGGSCLEGVYVCSPDYTGYYCQSEVPEKLTVAIRQIGSDSLRVGSSLMFECISTGSNDPRNTPVWRNPAGNRIFPVGQGGQDHLYVRQSSTTSTILVINKISEADAGRYECAVGREVTSLVIRVTDTGPPDSGCTPSCQNGGTCIGGQCLCPNQFIGEYCRIASK